MSKIKKYFQRKKEEAAFKLKLGGSMGQGRALNAQPEPSTSRQKSSPDAYVPPDHREISAEARSAADAAMARIEKKDHKEFNISLAAIKAQAKKELEAEKKAKEELASSSSRLSEPRPNNDKSNYACHGVFFRCPFISEEVLPKKDWKTKIKEFLQEQLESDRAVVSCLLIVNCNSKEKSKDCADILSKYLENIISNPNEEKFLKIRMSNRIFSEKVRYVVGALEFLYAAGFREVEIDNEPFLLWSADQMEENFTLHALLEELKNADIINLDLDRNIRVLLPSQARRVQLPDDFYRVSAEEIKREQQLRAETIANSQVLKTKAMREREEQRNLRMYKYSLVRVKFPNGIYIQGTFNVYEKICDVYDFVRSCLIDESISFHLVASSDGKLGDEDFEKTLHELKLVPNFLVLFIIPGQTVSTDINYLKEELLILVDSQ